LRCLYVVTSYRQRLRETIENLTNNNVIKLEIKMKNGWFGLGAKVALVLSMGTASAAVIYDESVDGDLDLHNNRASLFDSNFNTATPGTTISASFFDSFGPETGSLTTTLLGLSGTSRFHLVLFTLIKTES
jgi:hypothetical protein